MEQIQDGYECPIIQPVFIFYNPKNLNSNSKTVHTGFFCQIHDRFAWVHASMITLSCLV